MRLPIWTLYMLVAVLVIMLWPIYAFLAEGGHVQRGVMAGFTFGIAFSMVAYEIRGRREDRQRL